MTRRPRPARQAAVGRPPTNPTVCCCKPTLIATFRHQQLAMLHRWHWPHCGMPNTPVDVAEWESRR